MKFTNLAGRILYLSYVASAHPASTVAGICDALDTYAGEVRNLLDVDRLGITMVIPDTAAHALDGDTASLQELRAAIRRNRLDVTGIHGVPIRMYDPTRRYGVFRPDWAESERLEHTVLLATLLDRLMPDDINSGIVSTIPFFWRTRNDSQTRMAADTALKHLQDAIREHCERTGRDIRVAMEPEPGCAVETSSELQTWLGPITDLDGGPAVLGGCLDTCHMAVQFEDTTAAAENITTMTPPVFKLQLANALRVEDPSAHYDWLGNFVDPGRLHQTRERRPDGKIWGVDDLSAAIPGGLPGDSEWRIHYHMPVFEARNTCQDYTSMLLDHIVKNVDTVTHLETETYTWPMMPEHLRPPGTNWIAKGLARELSWVTERLEGNGYTRT